MSTATTTTVTRPQSKLSLDELAVSFIAQSIQAVSVPAPVLNPLADQATPLSPIFSEKALLAAKQRALEANIADQKALMNQYLAARTKGDRERLKRAMAERSRYVAPSFSPPLGHPRRLKARRAMEQELDALHARADAGKEAARALKFRWPETDKSACVFDISDDEGEGDE